jgi:hypothetical protein
MEGTRVWRGGSRLCPIPLAFSFHDDFETKAPK